VQEGVDKDEKTPLKDTWSSVFVHGVLTPSILGVVLPIPLALALPLLSSYMRDILGLPPITDSPTTGFGYRTAAALPVVALTHVLRRYGSSRHYGTPAYKRFWEAPSKFLITLFKVLNVLLYAEIILLVIITVLFYSVSDESRKSLYPYPLQTITEFTALQVTLAFTIYGIVVYLLIYARYFDKNFQFILAQKCMLEAKAKDDYDEKISHLIEALASYNKYLRRRFDLQFNETRVSSNILCSSLDKNHIVDTIENSFTDNPDDRLKPANCLSTFANLEPKEQFLTEKQLSTKIKEVFTILAAIIPAAIGVIQLVYP
jgi:hypothetical protein